MKDHVPSDWTVIWLEDNVISIGAPGGFTRMVTDWPDWKPAPDMVTWSPGRPESGLTTMLANPIPPPMLGMIPKPSGRLKIWVPFWPVMLSP